jgi:hypothetical protein
MSARTTRNLPSRGVALLLSAVLLQASLGGASAQTVKTPVPAGAMSAAAGIPVQTVLLGTPLGGALHLEQPLTGIVPLSPDSVHLTVQNAPARGELDAPNAATTPTTATLPHAKAVVNASLQRDALTPVLKTSELPSASVPGLTLTAAGESAQGPPDPTLDDPDRKHSATGATMRALVELSQRLRGKPADEVSASLVETDGAAPPRASDDAGIAAPSKEVVLILSMEDPLTLLPSMASWGLARRYRQAYPDRRMVSITAYDRESAKEGISSALREGESIRHLVVLSHGGNDIFEADNEPDVPKGAISGAGALVSASDLQDIGSFYAALRSPRTRFVGHEFDELFAPIRGRLSQDARVVLWACSVFGGSARHAARRAQAVLEYFGLSDGSVISARHTTIEFMGPLPLVALFVGLGALLAPFAFAVAIWVLGVGGAIISGLMLYQACERWLEVRQENDRAVRLRIVPLRRLSEILGIGGTKSPR